MERKKKRKLLASNIIFISSKSNVETNEWEMITYRHICLHVSALLDYFLFGEENVERDKYVHKSEYVQLRKSQ